MFDQLLIIGRMSPRSTLAMHFELGGWMAGVGWERCRCFCIFDHTKGLVTTREVALQRPRHRALNQTGGGKRFLIYSFENCGDFLLLLEPANNVLRTPIIRKSDRSDETFEVMMFAGLSTSFEVRFYAKCQRPFIVSLKLGPGREGSTSGFRKELPGHSKQGRSRWRCHD